MIFFKCRRTWKQWALATWLHRGAGWSDTPLILNGIAERGFAPWNWRADAATGKFIEQQASSRSPSIIKFGLLFADLDVSARFAYVI